jgi:FeS assembly SUF system protein
MNDMTEDALDRAQTQTPPNPGTAEPPAAGGAAPAELQMAVVDALRGVYVPEIPVNIHELGLIYRCDVSADGNVEVDMTLTAPACPVAGEMPGVVENAVRAVPGVADVKVELVWDPPWDQSMMSEAARLELGFY